MNRWISAALFTATIALAPSALASSAKLSAVPEAST